MPSLRQRNPETQVGAFRLRGAAGAGAPAGQATAPRTLAAARTRLERPPVPPARTAEQVLADELARARTAVAAAERRGSADLMLAHAELRRWTPGIFGYSETQRSIADKIAAAESVLARRDAKERAAAEHLVRTLGAGAAPPAE